MPFVFVFFFVTLHMQSEKRQWFVCTELLSIRLKAATLLGIFDICLSYKKNDYETFF